MQTSFMKLVYFSICCAVMTHPDQWKIVELRELKTVFMIMHRLDKSVYGAIFASA